MTGPAEVIVSPQGGGALWGTQEKLSPDLYADTDNFRVPRALVLRRNPFDQNAFHEKEMGCKFLLQLMT